jgi:hypothetical protein
VANALRVSETDLVGGPHLSADPQRADPHAGIPALREALAANRLAAPAAGRARPLPELARAVAVDVEPSRRAADYVKIGAVLPALLDELHVHTAAPADEAARRLALETLVEACVCAMGTAKNLGYPDLAHLATVRAEETADVLDEPVWLGKAAYLRALSTPWRVGATRVLASAERALDRVGRAAGAPEGTPAVGMLALSASLAAAVARRGDAAAHWLDEAAELAGRVPDDPQGAWQSFSATNVNVWRVTVAVERGEGGGAVLELAGRVDAAKLARRSSRRASFFADVGRGLARERATRAEAVRWLRRAEDAAPQRIRNNPRVGEAVAFLLGRVGDAALARELRGMAARMGLPH